MTETGTPDDDDALAAEYVVGVLPWEERQKLKSRLARDQGFAELVFGWSTRLDSLNDSYLPITPPRRVKAKIDAQLFPNPPVRWVRSFVLGLGAMAAAVVLAIGLQGVVSPAEFDLRAGMSAPDQPYEFVVEIDVDSDRFQVTQNSGVLPDGNAFELWLLGSDGVPESLGTFVSGRLRLGDTSKLSSGQTLAISLEPAGGSPTGLPTGPVIAVGVLGDA